MGVCAMGNAGRPINKGVSLIVFYISSGPSGFCAVWCSKLWTFSLKQSGGLLLVIPKGSHYKWRRMEEVTSWSQSKAKINSTMHQAIALRWSDRDCKLCETQSICYLISLFWLIKADILFSFEGCGGAGDTTCDEKGQNRDGGGKVREKEEVSICSSSGGYTL